jgi:uncharacterized protein (DUF302 family)
MSDQSATVTYTVPEPFDSAVSILRDAFSRRKLKVAEILNLSGRIQRRLSIRTSPCVVFLITSSEAGFEGLRGSRTASAFLPLHVVISDRGPQSEVHILRASQIDSQAIDGATLSALNRTQDEIAEAIDASTRLTANV